MVSLCVAAAAAPLSLWGIRWSVPESSDWKSTVEQGTPVLQLLSGKAPAASQPRRPVQFALADAGPFTGVTLSADLQPLGRSLILVYAYQDPAHFDYAHLSTDTAVKEPHHNGIFHVFGGERVRISDTSGPEAFNDGHRWYRVVLKWNGRTGEVKVSVDGHFVPALHAIDLSLTRGRIGIGSFDEKGNFRSVRLQALP